MSALPPKADVGRHLVDVRSETQLVFCIRCGFTFYLMNSKFEYELMANNVCLR